MPPSTHTSAAQTARETNPHHVRARPKQVAHRLPISKIGWDRKFRLVMMLVFGMVGWIGLKAGLALYAARGQAAQEASLVSSLQTQHRRLAAQEKALHQSSTIMRDARQLGMVRAGERSYVVVGLSKH
ncbi:MAG TPA: septum formation initiator family protein [Solirubrobacteraceae bacterium]|jgi:cell division protein FtsB|nr:septum formation initiator family protein [Solirubrobacteraceae bacterium]